jgi:phage tail-like protein
MALSKDQIRATYPLPVYNYKVEIDGNTVGFSEVTGLSIGYETATYVESALSGGVGPRRMYMPSQRKSATVTLKKGVVTGVSVPTLFAWINSIALNRVDKKDIYVRLCDETGAAVVSWKVINAFPTKLDAPGFTASSNDAAVESMELMADGVVIEQS